MTHYKGSLLELNCIVFMWCGLMFGEIYLFCCRELDENMAG